jgi:hypothetical protein
MFGKGEIRLFFSLAVFEQIIDGFISALAVEYHSFDFEVMSDLVLNEGELLGSAEMLDFGEFLFGGRAAVHVAF